MKRFLGIAIALLMTCPVSSGQSLKPQWMKSLPKPLRGNSSYIFVSIDAEAYNLDLGRKKCFQMLSLDRGLLNTVTLTYRSEDQISSTSQYEDGNFKEKIDEKSFEIITMDGKPIQLKAHIVDEYFDVRNNSLTTLYQVAVLPNSIFDNAIVTSKYSFQHIWPSFIVPGAGQMVKGDWLKGGLMMGGATLFAGGIALTECTRQVYLGKISQQSRNEEAVKIYANRASNLAIGRNICIGGICAVYIYSIIDAFVAPGARRVEVIPNGVAVNF